MGNASSNSRVDVGCWRHCLTVQDPDQNDRLLDRDAEATSRRTSITGRDGDHVTSALQYRQGRKQRQGQGVTMFAWIQTLVKIWRGELLEEEIKQSKRSVAEVRESLSCTRAMLDGEDEWLKPLRRE